MDSTIGKSTKLSKWFDWQEVTSSQTAAREGIDNSLPDRMRSAVSNTATQLDKVRETLGAPILVSSWYRSPALNKSVGGTQYSAHMAGEAVDFIAPRAGTPLQICKVLLLFKNILYWDQLILEHTWVHIAYNADPTLRPNRMQVLSLQSGGTYKTGLVSKEGIPL